MNKDMVLNKKFYRENPIDEINIADLFYIQYLTFAHQEMSDTMGDILSQLLDDKRKDVIREEDKAIEDLSNPEALIQFMRRNFDVINQEAVYKKALTMQEDFMPLALERYQKNRQEHFIQTCAYIFAGADIKYTKQLYEVYSNIKSAYARALACVVFGIKDFREATQLLLDEYYNLPKEYPGKHYEQCPLFSLYMFR